MSIPLWKPLLRKALACIDTLDDQGIKAKWSFGGGTAMMMSYSHRDSRDVDIFITDPQLIGHLSPRLQDNIQTITDCTAYDEQATILKLVLDTGEIDFIVAASLTRKPFEKWKFEGRTIQRERPVEIVAKKVFYRATDFRVRDVFDLACLLERESDAVAKEADLFRAKRDVLLPRLESMRPRYKEQAKQLIAVRPGFEKLRDAAIDRVLEFYQSAKE
jgi:hypothetical protein